MVYINSDTDKKLIKVKLVNHKNYPYGNQTLTYAMNALSLDTDSELLIFRSSATGGEQFFCFVKDLFIGNRQCSMQNVVDLFNSECYAVVSGGGGGGTCDISEVMCALGEVSCAMDNIAGEPIGHYITVNECIENNEIIEEINGEQV